MQIGHSAAQHGAEDIVEEQEGCYVEQRADGTEGQHEPPQCFPRPVPRRESFLIVHIVPRQDDAQHIVQQIQQQQLQGGHGQEGQKRAGADDGENIAEVGAGGDLDILEHIGEGLSPLQNALFQHAEILMQQHHICRVLGGIHRRIHRDAHIGFTEGGNIVDAVPQKAHGMPVLL